MNSNLSMCAECGMAVSPGEYHPFAACLMFKACHDGDQVRANLDSVRGHSAQQDADKVTELPDAVQYYGTVDDPSATNPAMPGDALRYALKHCGVNQDSEGGAWFHEFALQKLAILLARKRVQPASGTAQWIEHLDIRDWPDVVLTDAGRALKQSQITGKQAYAGVLVWLGDKQSTSVLTEIEVMSSYGSRHILEFSALEALRPFINAMQQGGKPCA